MTSPQQPARGVHVLVRQEDLIECPTCGALAWNNPASQAKHQKTHHGKANQS